MGQTDTFLDAWSQVIVRDGWVGARIDGVARLAGVAIDAVVDAVPDRWAALRGVQARYDRAALIEAASDPDDSVRNRLFGLLMARFDAAQEDRALAATLAAAARRDPGLAAFFASALPQSVARVAEAAGVDCGGWLGPARIGVLSGLYARVARVWLGDDTPDLAPTMKALDSALAQGEQLARLVPHWPKALPATPAPSGGLRAE